MSEGHNRYGFVEDFQRGILSLCLRTPRFLSQHRQVLSAELFAPGYDVLCGAILVHYDGTGRPPTEGEVLERLKTYECPDFIKEAAVGFLSRVQELELPDADFVAGSVRDFAAKQAVDRVVANRGLYGTDYDKMLRDLGEASALRFPEPEIVSYNLGIADRMGVVNAKVRPVPTGLPSLDRHIKGGVGEGEMFLLLGLPKAGKSQVLVNFASHAAESGYPTWFISLEMRLHQLLQRFDQRLARKTAAVLVREDAGSLTAKVGDRLNFVVENARRLSVNGIRARLDRTVPDQMPKLLVVDYGQLLKGGDTADPGAVRHVYEQIYLDLRSLAGEYGVALWSAAQANREGAKTRKLVNFKGEEKPSEPLTGEHMAECWAAIQHADGCISINATIPEKISHDMRLHLSEIRDGEDGQTVPVKFDWHRSLCWEE